MYRGYATALLDCNGKEIAKHGIYEGKRKAECLKWWKSQPVADEASKMQNGHDSQEDANEPAQETRAEHRTDGKQIQISRLKHSIQKNVNGATRSKQRFHICGTCPVHSLGIFSWFHTGSDAWVFGRVVTTDTEA
mmetsp:Transcript_6840/g.16146  ORF Transcript_6840/g.16146 Transcript_6840/m.16146 type:complete len:135 (+) Transcript_6840:254-658(+)